MRILSSHLFRREQLARRGAQALCALDEEIALLHREAQPRVAAKLRLVAAARAREEDDAVRLRHRQQRVGAHAVGQLHPHEVAAVGRRLDRRFDKTCTLQAAIDLVESEDPDGEEINLVSNFPRKVYTRAMRTETLEALGLHPGAQLFTQEIEEDDDE